MTTITQPTFLNKKLFLNVTMATLLLLAVMAVSFGLHIYNIQSIGDANAYYTAAVKSMLQSWSNFFFVAAEPGGSVTVDKPPLGLWIEAAFAYFLGVSGFSVSLPNILAGVFGIPILYHLVKKYMPRGTRPPIDPNTSFAWSITSAVTVVMPRPRARRSISLRAIGRTKSGMLSSRADPRWPTRRSRRRRALTPRSRRA